MSKTSNNNGIPEKQSNGSVKRKYYCEQFTEKQLGLPTHIYTQIFIGLPHVLGVIGSYKFYTLQYPAVIPVVFLFLFLAGFGTTLGAHRFYTHKAYKAKLPLQILLVIMQTISMQLPLFKWCRDHRIHHKYVDTESDPHNSRLGFWHCHIGWLFIPESQAFKEKIDTIDLSDLDNDPLVRFQAKYYWYMVLVLAFIAPMSAMKYLVPELTLFELICLNYVWYIHSLNFTFLVNSAAHLWGDRPYDKSIRPRENKIVSFFAIGEGSHNIYWHNYHHTFPYDYKTSELGLYRLNWSTMLIDFFASIGWAYDLKTIPWNIVKDRVKRTGDGSHDVYGTNNKKNEVDIIRSEQDSSKLPVWGWGDEDMTPEDYQIAEICKPISSKATG